MPTERKEDVFSLSKSPRKERDSFKSRVTCNTRQEAVILYLTICDYRQWAVIQQDSGLMTVGYLT